MFLQDKRSGDLVRIEDLETLFDPLERKICGCGQAGEEEQDATEFAKDQLIFPSGESLPRCWRDVNYHVDHSRESSRAG